MKHDLIFVQWTNNYGGIEKISQLLEEKFETYHPLIVMFQYKASGISYKNFKIITDKPKISFILKYFFFIRENKSSIIHIQYAGSAILFLTYTAGARKIIYHFHGTQFPNKFLMKLTWKIIGSKVTVIANSAHTKNLIREKFNYRSNINLIPNFIDLSKFKYLERAYEGGKFIVSFVGRFDRGKNINVIVDTAKVIRQIDGDIEFHLVGDGTEKEIIEKKVVGGNLQSQVKILYSTDDIQKVYYETNLFLFLSSYESFGNVIAEAILTGLPVLCYDIPAVRELVNDDFFFVNKLDAKIVAERIVQIKHEYQTAAEKVNQIHQYLREKLNNDKIIGDLKALYGKFGTVK